MTRYRCFVPTSLLSGWTFGAMTHLPALPRAARLNVMSIYYTNATKYLRFWD